MLGSIQALRLHIPLLLQVGERRVMGVGQQAIATRVATRAQLVWDVPPSWSLAQAATVPVAYCTAYYSLVMRGRLRRGQRVLIHSGSGAVGLASIALCLHRGCEVHSAKYKCGKACRVAGYRSGNTPSLPALYMHVVATQSASTSSGGTHAVRSPEEQEYPMQCFELQ